MRSLLFAGLIAFAAAFAQNDPAPAFEAASVKPNHSGSGSSSTHSRPANIVMQNVSLLRIITAAYRVKEYQVSGPNWLGSEHFDVVAKAPFGTPDSQFAPMLRTLLADRFKLETHQETKDFPVYGLVAAKGGFLLKPVEAAGGSSMNSNSDEKGGQLKAERATMAGVADWLAAHGRMDRPVLDMTGIPGAYDFTLKFSLENDKSDKSDSDTPKYPVVPLAIQEQLGLRLEKRTAPIQLLVIDRAEKVPVEN